MARSLPQTLARVASLIHGQLAGKQGLAGFTLQAPHLSRELEGTVQAIALETNSARSAGAFTLNLVVTSDLLHRCWSGLPVPSNPGAAQVPLVVPIGTLLPGGAERWWPVDENSDPERLASELVALLVEHAAPFFEVYGAPAGMLESLRASHARPGLTAPLAHLLHGVLAAQLGHIAEARQQLDLAAQADGGSAQELARSVGSRLRRRVPEL